MITNPNDKAVLSIMKLLDIPRKDKTTKLEISKIIKTFELEIGEKNKSRIERLEEDSRKFNQVKRLLR